VINFAKRRATAKANHQPEENVGIGIAMAMGLFCLTTMASIGNHQVNSVHLYTGLFLC
jgi:ATP-binding cassette subfamily C (CFTR/MRP) protein 1